MNVCNYQRIHQPFDVRGINERFSILFKEVCYLRGYTSSNPTLDAVLGFGNTAYDKTAIFTDGSSKTTIQSDRIIMENSNGFSAIFKADNVTSNITLQARNLSGTIALLSDIVSPSGPITINTKPSDYTLQLSDGDNNTLVEMDVAVPNNINVDSDIDFPIGTQIMVASYGAGKTTITPRNLTVILTPNNVDSDLTFQNSMGVLIKRSATEWYFEGDIGPAATGILTIVPGTNITVDNTDPFNPIVSSSASGGSGWNLTGDSGTDSTINFIGTTDDEDFIIKRNSIQAGLFSVGNTAIGVGALLTPASNSNSSAFGVDALASLTSGRFNVAMGIGALGSLTTGNYCIGIGTYAGSNLPSNNQYSIAIGESALANSGGAATNGQIAIGYAALLGGGIARNTVIGYSSMGSVIGSSDNTTLGYQAFNTLESLGTPSSGHNTGVGSKAGTSVQLGGKNTFIGSQTDGTTNNTTSAIALGYNAKAASKQFAISPDITQIKATGLSTGVGYALTDVAGNGVLTMQPNPRTYKVLVGNLTSTGTSISFTEFENTTGVTFTVNRTAVGSYSITANSGTPFTTNKTGVFISNTDPTGSGGDLYAVSNYIVNNTTMTIISQSLGFGSSDDILNNTMIEVRIYP